MQIIETEHDLAQATQALVDQVPAFGPILKATGPLPLRRQPGGFGAVLKILVGQQVSVAAASAIWARVCDAGINDAQALGQASDADILALGFSRPKLRYARALVAADLDYAALEHAADVEVMNTLTTVTGIGPWTAHIYLLQCLGRPDIFPAADLALQEAAKIAFDLPYRPRAPEMDTIAQPWSPYRSVAARALWAYYAHIKQREGMAI